MVTKGLIVRLEAKAGEEEAVDRFLRGALPLVRQEPETIVWFALRLGRSTFAIVDAFASEEGRRAHLEGRVAAALMENAETLLAEAPVIEQVDVLAARLP
jgi:quinol monooxygenase YgiN